MKFITYVSLLICCAFASCKLMHPDRSMPDNKRFGRLLNEYYEDRMRYFPMEATQNGDYRYNDQFPIEFTIVTRILCVVFTVVILRKYLCLTVID